MIGFFLKRVKASTIHFQPRLAGTLRMFIYGSFVGRRSGSAGTMIEKDTPKTLRVMLVGEFPGTR